MDILLRNDRRGTVQTVRRALGTGHLKRGGNGLGLAHSYSALLISRALLLKKPEWFQSWFQSFFREKVKSYYNLYNLSRYSLSRQK